MSYQVFARRWRPQKFSELIGQSIVKLSLENTLKQKQLSHALLFTGPRGTGKTSTARLVAKALRCLDPNEGLPCGVCEECKQIEQGSQIDVLEIDGASHNGVDSVRELRDSVAFKPTSGTKKIYIVDEVHMLSSSAFNALLKTLEEPPDHVVFILATTEIHKIPETIKSRCQRYDFTVLTEAEITQQLTKICETENIKFEAEAIQLITEAARGSLRDSLSFLEQVVAVSGESGINLEFVRSSLGLVDRSLVQKAILSLVTKDKAMAFEVIEAVQLMGQSPKTLLEDLLKSIRQSLIYILKKDEIEDDIFFRDRWVLTEGLMSALANTSVEDLYLYFDMSLKCLEDVASCPLPQIAFDIGFLRMVQSPKHLDLQKWMMQESFAGSVVATSGGPLPGARSSVPVQPVSATYTNNQKSSHSIRSQQVQPSTSTLPKKIERPKPQFVKDNEKAGFAPINMNKAELKDPSSVKGIAGDQVVGDLWPVFVKYTQKLNPPLGAVLNNAKAKLVEDKIHFFSSEDSAFLRDYLKKHSGDVEKLASDYFKKPMRLEFVKASGDSSKPDSQLEKKKKEEVLKEQELQEKLQSDPKFQALNKEIKVKIQSIKEVPS